MKIGSVDLSKKVLVVAEIGNNHEGNFSVACDLVKRAAETGVDMVKFQTFRTHLFVSNADPARVARMKKFELTFEQFAELETLARSLGLLFMSTPLDLESLAFLAPRVDAMKIASGDNNFVALIEGACRVGKPIILSTGLATLDDIAKSVGIANNVFAENRVEPQLALLHCVSAYPVPPADANLRAVQTLAAKFGCVTGYSDHTMGADACVAAVALGARIIEKHFTLSKTFSDFRDHQLSSDPDEMKQLVQSIRNVEAMLGTGEKVVQPSEAVNAQVARRSIVAARKLNEGHVINTDDLMWVRPAIGLNPGDEKQLIGKTLAKSRDIGEVILLSDLQ